MDIAISASPDQDFAHFIQGSEHRAFVFEFPQYYLPGSPVVALLAVLVAMPGGYKAVTVTDKIAEGKAWLAARELMSSNLRDFSETVAAPILSLEGGWKLQAVNIPKPWGQEIWYTGIEARGQSRVTDGKFSVPLPWILALGTGLLLAPGCREPNLLKILDPLEEEVFGDLYFELHEEKQEVYVVTGISRVAWPGGKGAIRYGFSPEVRGRYADDEAFRQAYLETVRHYEKVRRSIDARVDEFRAAENIPMNEPVDAQILKTWLSRIPAEMQREERAARQAMNAFTHMVALELGDVVKVATRTPHALQHGVRTVEFQTPVYERKILSFVQKVLTQEHWNTDEAVSLMRLEPGEVEVLPLLEETAGYRLEQVVAFDDFVVYRLTLQAGNVYRLPAVAHYRVLFIVSGELSLDGLGLSPEEAALVPATVGLSALHNPGKSGAVCLISVPQRPEYPK